MILAKGFFRMENYIIKTLAYNKQVRVLFLDNTNMVKEICNKGNMNKLLKSSLGKTISIACLISGILKAQQRISLKVNTSHPKYKIFADTDSMGNIRGYLSDHLLNSPLNGKRHATIEQLIGNKGYIQVIKDLGMNSIFTGITDMPYGNIENDFSHYFNQSEQTPTYIKLYIIFDKNNDIILSRGIFVQLLPGASIHLMDKVKQIISENQFVLTNAESLEIVKERVLHLFEESMYMGSDAVQFLCGCSKEMFYGMLFSLSKEELLDSIQKNNQIETVCNICGEKYYFSPLEIRNMLKSY